MTKPTPEMSDAYLMELRRQRDEAARIGDHKTALALNERIKYVKDGHKVLNERLWRMKIRQVAHSNVVGSSLEISADGVGVVALLTILVPQPHLDYKTVADAVANAVLKGHVSERAVTLVLPEDIFVGARAAIAAVEEKQ